MPILQRVIQGKIFADEFNTTVLDPSRWIVSPSDNTRYSITDVADSLRLKHGDCPVFILTDIPDCDFVYEMKNDYKPVTSTDTGGIVLYNTITNRVEFVEFYDPIIDTTYNYLYLRVVRKGKVFEGYGSQNRTTWEYIGAVTIDTPQKIGFVLNGVYNGLAKYLDIQYAYLMSSRYIYATNLQSGFTVKLKKADGTLIDQNTIPVGKSVAAFDLFFSLWPFNGFIEVYSPSNQLITKSPTYSLYPGDILDYSVHVSARFEKVKFEEEWDPIHSDFKKIVRVVSNTPLSLEEMVMLGNVESGMIEGSIFIKNNESVPITNLEVMIANYDGVFGNQWCKLTLDINGLPDEEHYLTSVLIPVIAPGVEVRIWLKILRDLNAPPMTADEFRFRLVLNNI